MKATIEGIEIEGSVEEIFDFIEHKLKGSSTATSNAKLSKKAHIVNYDDIKPLERPLKQALQERRAIIAKNTKARRRAIRRAKLIKDIDAAIHVRRNTKRTIGYLARTHNKTRQQITNLMHQRRKKLGIAAHYNKVKKKF